MDEHALNIPEDMQEPGFLTFSQPPEPKWEWCIAGDWFMVWRVPKGPHWLGRLLQKWFLDIHWRKVK